MCRGTWRELGSAVSDKFKRFSLVFFLGALRDQEVATFSIPDLKHRPLALIANYSLHYVGTIPDNQVSADYCGEFSRLIGVSLRRPADSGFVGILSNGTSGDVNNINFAERRPPREPFEQVRQVATKVADSAFRAYASINHRSDVTLGIPTPSLSVEPLEPAPVFSLIYFPRFACQESPAIS